MRTALVTGAAGNLGAAVVKKFLAGSFRVVGTVSANDLQRPDFTSDAFDQRTVDLSNEDQTQQLLTSVIKKYGSIDAAVLTVGGFASGRIADTSAAALLEQYQLNFLTAYNVARPVFLQMMQQGHGRIFFIGSKAGLSADDGQGLVAYSLAKSLLLQLAGLMNKEASGKNVVCAVLVPGTIDTPLNRKSMPTVDPAGWVRPSSIADIIHFYCTDVAAAIRQPVIKVYNNS